MTEQTDEKNLKQAGLTDAAKADHGASTESKPHPEPTLPKDAKAPEHEPKTGDVKVQEGVTVTVDDKNKQIHDTLKQEKERSDANEEGHAKNMAEIEEAHAKGAEAQDKADQPTSGMERNRNTPRIDPKTGVKHWD